MTATSTKFNLSNLTDEQLKRHAAAVEDEIKLRRERRNSTAKQEVAIKRGDRFWVNHQKYGNQIFVAHKLNRKKVRAYIEDQPKQMFDVPYSLIQKAHAD